MVHSILLQSLPRKYWTKRILVWIFMIFVRLFTILLIISIETTYWNKSVARSRLLSSLCAKIHSRSCLFGKLLKVSWHLWKPTEKWNQLGSKILKVLSVPSYQILSYLSILKHIKQASIDGIDTRMQYSSANSTLFQDKYFKKDFIRTAGRINIRLASINYQRILYDHDSSQIFKVLLLISEKKNWLKIIENVMFTTTLGKVNQVLGHWILFQQSYCHLFEV